jgi:hypothetical protein
VAVVPAERRVKIIDVFEIPSAEPGRLGKYDVIVTYQDEAMRARTITIPREELEGKSPEERLRIIANAIKAKEQERLAIVGREVVI